MGHEALDLGTHSAEPVDYPDYAERAAHAIAEKRADRHVRRLHKVMSFEKA